MSQHTEHAASTAHLHKEISHLRHELKTSKEGHPASSEKIRVGDYLLDRLAQLGVTVSTPLIDVRCLRSESLSYRPCSAFQEISTLVSLLTALERSATDFEIARFLGIRVIPLDGTQSTDYCDILPGPCGRSPQDPLGWKLVS